MANRIDTPTSRAKLRIRRDPYWLKLDAGKYLGYRRSAGDGTWIAKAHRRPGSTAPYDYHSLGEQPSFTAAKESAEQWFATVDEGIAGHYAIEELVKDYVADTRINKGDDAAHAAEVMLKREVLAKFKGREVASITTAEYKKWLHGFVPRGVDEDKKRAAKETANRKWAQFRAALSLAYTDGKIARDDAWRRVKAFQDVGAPREFYPSPEQVAALIEHCDEAFRPLVRAAALTGFRLQAFTGALVADFDAKHGTLAIKKDKDHARVATLSSAAVELFKEQAKDKTPAAHLFVRADGKPWGVSHQQRPWRAACERVNADPNVPKEARCPRQFIFYSLRHYFISRALLAGMSVEALAKNVGTSPAMIAKSYGKWIRSDVRDMLDRVEVTA